MQERISKMSWDIYSSRKSVLISLLFLSFSLSILPGGVEGLPLLDGGDINNDSSTGDFGVGTVIFLGLVSLVSLVSVAFLCGFGGQGCCGVKIYWFGRSRTAVRRTVEVPLEHNLSFANANYSMDSNVRSFDQIDVRALAMDPVVFEPLPTILDLAPMPISTDNEGGGGNHGMGDRRGRGSLRGMGIGPTSIPTPMVVPFAADDAELYAHDWFDEPYHNFQRNNLEFIREVGRGWFGEVLEAEAKDIVPYARKVKVLVKRLKEEATQIDQMRFLDECRMYRDADQGNILKLLGHAIERLPFLLILEYWPQGDLKSYLIANVTRAESLSVQGILLKMAVDIAKGLEWLLNSNFKHPDLAARNCQVASEGRVVIGDYGLATQIFRDDYYWNSNVPIPLRWAAPETIHCTPTTIQTLKVSKSSNVWTYAVVLWEVIEFGKLPYFELTDEEVITRVLAAKNYFLGQPTLPYIPYKEGLHEVMRSCWSIDPDLRPDMATVINQLQLLTQQVSCGKGKNANEEFDEKWEKLGRLSSTTSGAGSDQDSPKGRGAKKSVSFAGIENAKLEEPVVKEKGKSSEEESGIAMSSENLVETQEDDDDDNENWMHELEDGGISQKVMEKSQSLQDFLVLTHVEPSDMHGPESLGEFVPEREDEVSQQPTDDSVQLTCKEDSSNSKNSNSDRDNLNNDQTSHPTDNDSTLVLVYQGSTETEESGPISSTDKNQDTTGAAPSNSSQKVENTLQMSSIQVPELAFLPPTPGTTPNMTGIDINVVQPTPSPHKQNGSHNGSPYKNGVGISSNSNQEHIFKFPNGNEGDKDVNNLNNTTPPTRRSKRRHSTPIRSDRSKSPIGQNESLNGDPDEVFEKESDTDEYFPESCNLSPIALKRQLRRQVNHGGSITTIVGASDDLGLDIFQGVTSRIDDTSFCENDSSEEQDRSTPVINGNSNGYPVQHIPPNMQVTPPPKSKLLDIFNSNASIVTPSPGAASCKVVSTVDRCLDHKPENDPSSSSWDVVTSADIHAENKSSGNSTELGVEAKVSDDGEFWSNQFKLLNSAAADTKSLLAMSLDVGEEVIVQPESNDKFVEDIQEMNEECGSLIFEDLENQKATIVPESSRVLTTEEPNEQPKFAFSRNGIAKKEDIQHPVTDQTSVEPWALKITTQTPSETDVDDEAGSSSSGPPSLSTCKDFVPSTWNQSLTPARPALKSPLADTSAEKSSLKKSVSFERPKKRQLVYSYPPAPHPTSDSEEEIPRKVAINSDSPPSIKLPAPSLPALPMHSSLDWDLTQEELEFAQMNPVDDNSDEEPTTKSDPIDMYKLSGFDLNESFKVRPSQEPFDFPSTSTTTLGELRHTRHQLKLNLFKGEATLLDEESADNRRSDNQTESVEGLDSGVGSSTHEPPSPFIPTSTSSSSSNQNQNS